MSLFDFIYPQREEKETDLWHTSSPVMWQTCPVCHGSGVDPNCRIANTAFPPCPTCNGKRIISLLSGLPPEQ